MLPPFLFSYLQLSYLYAGSLLSYCARSGSGPPWLVGHSVFYKLCRVAEPIVLEQMARTTVRVASDRTLGSSSNGMPCEQQVIAAEPGICPVW
jgi:hypothetical protein